MQLVRFNLARRAASCLALLAFAITSCGSSPEVRSARYIQSGKKLLEKKDTAHAILQFENAVKTTPNRTEPYCQIGVAFLATKDVRQGVAALNKSPGPEFRWTVQWEHFV